MYAKDAVKNQTMNRLSLKPVSETLLDLPGASVLIIGAGRCGLSAARLLFRAGSNVTVSDHKPRELWPNEFRFLESQGVKIEAGQNTVPKNTQLIVRSPGVPRHSEIIQSVYSLGIPVVSEIELASWFCKAPVIAVTGTDGKSTVVSMIQHVLQSMKVNSLLTGNIGTPFCEIAQEDGVSDLDWVVVEVSSYALEDIHLFRPRIAALLNIAQDHLDHYESFDEYAFFKGRISLNQTPEDYFLLNAADEKCIQFTGLSQAKALAFSLAPHSVDGVFFSGVDAVTLRLGGMEKVLKVAVGDWFSHQKENFLVALLATAICGVEPKDACTALRDFKFLPHRIQWIAEQNGIQFYDDSKATSCHATCAALRSMQKPVVLIAGGDAKGQDLSVLGALVAKKVKALIVLGRSRDQFMNLFQSVVPCKQVSEMQEAARVAVQLAAPGDVVLLSPACSSLDMFKNFEERGEAFREAVLEMCHAE